MKNSETKKFGIRGLGSIGFNPAKNKDSASIAYFVEGGIISQDYLRSPSDRYRYLPSFHRANRRQMGANVNLFLFQCMQ